MTTLWRHIEERAARHAALPHVAALQQERSPAARSAGVLRERAMVARWLEDVVRAATEIPSGPFARFAREHRAREAARRGRHEEELRRSGLPSMSADDWFCPELLPARIQVARILARCHDALPEERMTILACLEAASVVTFGLRAGDAAGERMRAALGVLGYSGLPQLHDVVDLVFDALTTMLGERGGPGGRDAGPPGEPPVSSGPDHDEQHLERRDRAHRVGLAGGEPEDVARVDAVRLARDRDVGVALEVEHEGVERGRVLAQALPRVEREHRDRAHRLLHESAADDGARLEGDEIRGDHGSLEERIGLRFLRHATSLGSALAALRHGRCGHRGWKRTRWLTGSRRAIPLTG